MLIAMLLNDLMCSLMLPIIIIGGWLMANYEEEEIERRKDMRRRIELSNWQPDFSDKPKKRKRKKKDEDAD